MSLLYGLQRAFHHPIPQGPRPEWRLMLNQPAPSSVPDSGRAAGIIVSCSGNGLAGKILGWQYVCWPNDWVEDMSGCPMSGGPMSSGPRSGGPMSSGPMSVAQCPVAKCCAAQCRVAKCRKTCTEYTCTATKASITVFKYLFQQNMLMIEL